MDKPDIKKKVWSKPEVKTLNIKRDTFSGSVTGPEGVGNLDKKGPPGPPGS